MKTVVLVKLEIGMPLQIPETRNDIMHGTKILSRRRLSSGGSLANSQGLQVHPCLIIPMIARRFTKSFKLSSYYAQSYTRTV